ncbi:MAG: sodium:solute symporter [Gracilibacter sp. BRH_c7a]|nr:MAG: sodium:solute symporter [Gracilibacter sp. BRH_c7a]
MLTKSIVMLLYLAVIVYLGYKGYKQTRDSSDYLLAGRKTAPAVMALSYGASFISTSAIVGFGGLAGVFGMSLLWLTFLNIFVGIFIAFVVFGKRTRAMGQNLNANTFAELLGKRYQSNFIRKFVAGVVLVFMPVYTAAVMIGAAKFIEGSLDIGYNSALLIMAVIVAAYVFWGGMKAVMYSDAFQGVLMFGGMLFLIFWTYKGLGGITSAHLQLSELFNNATVQEQAAGLAKGGFQGWTAMPTTLSVNWWVVLSSIVLGVGIGTLAQPQLAVRFMTVKSTKDLNRAIPVGGVFILMMTGVAFVVGALSNVYFFNTTGKIAVAAAGGTDSIIPLFINNFMPAWFSSLFLVTIVSAAMSTLSAQFHTIGAAVGRDLISESYDSDDKGMLSSKLGMLAGIFLTIALSYFLPKIWDAAIGISTGLFFGLCGAAFIPMYIGALYSKRMNRTTAVTSMLTGFIVSLLWMTFVHSKESVVFKISQLLFNKPFLFNSNIQYVDPILISLTVSSLVAIILTALQKPDDNNQHVEKCFEGIK